MTGTFGSAVAIRRSALRMRVLCCLIGGTGLVLVIAGSFLPWVVSGTVRRSSYEIVGVLDRLGVADGGVIGGLIAGWPFIGVLCMTPFVAAALRWWRTAGALSVLVALAAGALSIGILAVGASAGGLLVAVDPLGPAVMAAGAILTLSAGVAVALGAGSPVRRSENGPNAN